MQKIKIRNLVLAALFSAVIFICTYVTHISYGGSGGYIHFGDTIIYLAASFLSPMYAVLAGAVGAGLADILSGAAIWAPFTIAIKPLMALCFTSKGNNKLLAGNTRNAVAPIIAGVICIVGYYLAEAVITQNLISPFASAWGNAVQAVGSAGFYYIIAGVVDKTDLLKRL